MPSTETDFDLRSPSHSSFLGISEPTFADVGNLDHCVKYLNQTLVTFGFPTSLDLFATDPVSVARTCNCVYSLLQQRQRDIEFRESANEQRQRFIIVNLVAVYVLGPMDQTKGKITKEFKCTVELDPKLILRLVALSSDILMDAVRLFNNAGSRTYKGLFAISDEVRSSQRADKAASKRACEKEITKSIYGSLLEHLRKGAHEEST
ncbi:hypothetical protein RJ639_047242 [Escallonia herrerae]|uniref:Uncharacterized protein n=1 Tax=Escallonia herrerae TaxID=1293975 RepID=A0AA88W5Q2_9ASTE|nr:hypothetical protein RJ639_047242 [Escallonia herrerae]